MSHSYRSGEIAGIIKRNDFVTVKIPIVDTHQNRFTILSSTYHVCLWGKSSKIPIISAYLDLWMRTTKLPESHASPM